MEEAKIMDQMVRAFATAMSSTMRPPEAPVLKSGRDLDAGANWKRLLERYRRRGGRDPLDELVARKLHAVLFRGVDRDVYEAAFDGTEACVAAENAAVQRILDNMWPGERTQDRMLILRSLKKLKMERNSAEEVILPRYLTYYESFLRYAVFATGERELTKKE